MFCRMPYNSLLIQPDGRLSMCCSQNMRFDYGHISTTEDLYEAWKERKNAKRIRDYETSFVNFACGHCLKESKYTENRWVQVNTIPMYTDIPMDGKIRFLEFTTSNICNQTCTSCSSYFSSKWKALEQEALELNLPLDEWKDGVGFNSFGVDNYRLSDYDIEKIFKLLPDLHTIYVKGGEPFADDNNYKVLKELFRVNPNCLVHISSNMSKIPEKYLKLLSGKTVILSCSMDGIKETYEYIRSTKFDNSIENLKRWNSAKINGRVNISITASLYNMYNMNETLEYWKREMNKLIDAVYVQRWIRQPSFLSPSFIMTQKQINEYYSSYLKTNVNGYQKNLKSLKSENIRFSDREKLIERFHMYTKFMNYKRGINIYDIHPQLKEL